MARTATRTTTPAFSIKGRLVFRPNDGDTEHDLGEVEFGPVQPIVNAYAKRQTFATGGIVPSGRTILLERRGCDYVIPKAEVERLGSIATLPEAMKPNLPTPRASMKSAIEAAVRGMTVDFYNGQ